MGGTLWLEWVVHFDLIRQTIEVWLRGHPSGTQTKKLKLKKICYKRTEIAMLCPEKTQ